MKDISVKDFCREYKPCDPGAEFAKNFSMMHEVYESLLAGAPDPATAASWLGWILNKQGIVPPEDRQQVALALAELLKDDITEPGQRDLLSLALERKEDATLAKAKELEQMYYKIYTSAITDAGLPEEDRLKAYTDFCKASVIRWAVTGSPWLTGVMSRSIYYNAHCPEKHEVRMFHLRQLVEKQLEVFRKYGDIFVKAPPQEPTEKQYRILQQRHCKDCRMSCDVYGMIRVRNREERKDEYIRCPKLRELAMRKLAEGSLPPAE